MYSRGRAVMDHCDGRVALLGDIDMSFVLFSVFSKFLLCLKCYLLVGVMRLSQWFVMVRL